MAVKSLKLDKWEVLGLQFACGSFSDAVESKDLSKRLDKIQGGGTFTPNKVDLEYLEYWKKMLVEYPNSPHAKYMDAGLKSAIIKIFELGLHESVEMNEAKDSMDLSKIKSLLDKIGEYGSDFSRSIEGFSHDLNNESKVEVSKYLIKDAKDYLAKYAKAYEELAKEIIKLGEGYYNTSNGALMESAEMNESAYDPFKGLKKVADPNPNGKLPSGFVTDGLGNIYKVPTDGYSSVQKYKDMKFRYSFKHKELQLIDDKKKVIDSQGLSPASWFENPQYWIEKYYEDIEEELSSIVFESVESLTPMEKQVMIEITEDQFYEDGLDSTIWADVFLDTTKLESKVVRGVLSSLIKKGMIYPIAKGRDGVIAYTKKGKEYMKSLGYK